MSGKIIFLFFPVPPHIGGSDELTQLTVIEGNLISLLCESSGIPPPNLIWKKKGQFSSLKFIKLNENRRWILTLFDKCVRL